MTLFEKLFGTFKFKTIAENKLFETMLSEYMSNIPDNFYKNQFDLANDIAGTTYDLWAKFLTHSSFTSWKAEQIAIIANTQTDKALAGNELNNKEAISLLTARNTVLDKDKKTQKPVIIVIPESLYFRNEDEE